MAQTARTPAEKNQETPVAPRRGGKMLLIIVLAAMLILLLAVLGVGALLIMKKNAGNNQDSSAEAVMPATPAPPVVSAIDLNKPPVFVPLDTFTANLRAAEGEDPHFLQIEITLRVTDQKTAEALKGWMPEIRNRINLALASKHLTDIRADAGHEKLANEILRDLNTLFGVPPPPPGVPAVQAPLGPIQGVLFISFIVQ